ncbi:hypothetical protein [Paraburkholderia susongensis]|uniref:Uncharacterized protein n=1 Tax=Paraburkholderia susongensis TaxID=1515439 RepID=A0A1X7LSA3_9BURK|nr:hypothetical protein [Paraburkholderia susongensis]SMG56142.1 hypothetical protein SAMN06265784_10843 [Paraburkholderia susongensis]
MKQQIRKPAAERATGVSGASGLTYRRYVAASRARFFAQAHASSVDLLTLVVAEALKRKAQAEIRRDVLRDALYEMPAGRGRDRERDMPRQPAEGDGGSDSGFGLDLGLDE